MSGLAEVLRDQCVVVNLGAGGDTGYRLPAQLQKALTVIEIDGADAVQDGRQYHRHHRLQRVIAGTAGQRAFRVNRFVSCSSLRQPDETLITHYGLQDYYATVSTTMLDCVTLPSVLNELGIAAIDFLKTDLEGEDFAVLQSMEPYFDRIGMIQMELRFQPFYQGEPYFHEVVSYLHRFGFVPVGFAPEYWRPVTRKRGYQDGCIVWADVLFLKSVERISAAQLSLTIAKQILFLSMLRRRGYARYLAERFRDQMPAEWRGDLDVLTDPLPRWQIAWQVVRPLLGRVRRFLRAGAAPTFRFEHIAKW